MFRAKRALVMALAIVASAITGACAPGTSAEDAGPSSSWEGEPWAARVVSFIPGEGGGHNAHKLPDVVLGPPKGAGEVAGNIDDVLSLGEGGVIVLELGLDVVDGDGPDLAVFENAFRFGASVFAEPGEVSVSVDGEEWATFPCAPDEPAPNGCAGYAPVLKDDEGTLSPGELGGDLFDLADVGVTRARFVRIEDVGERRFGDEGMTGFDLDALGVLHPASE